MAQKKAQKELKIHSLKRKDAVGMSCGMSETPFYPREKLVEKQKYYQSVRKYTHLKGPVDKITSVAIPLALATTAIFMIGRGIYNMSHGIGKKE
ncbi:hypothetical protein RND71_013287 [Anisodus tanguticus]|uniref:Uncharacterized protein n=1 Tax=Anisodus tanguticus TaxID=243964 RepID=A0AAE1SGC4_9SOLA|nr:hypothetical protein RND71_013287 [Anisodus tanguticus]